MPQKDLPNKFYLPKQNNGKRPVGRPRIVDLGWNRLGLHTSEMMEVMKDREAWQLNLKLLPLQPLRKIEQRKCKQLSSYFPTS